MRSTKDFTCEDALAPPVGQVSVSDILCPGEHTIDIGASFGDTTVSMALRAAYGGGRTVAFEPYTAAFTVLEWLSKLNPGLLIDPYQFPLDSKGGDWYGMSDGAFWSNANK